jgi:hypothetical protein
VISNQDVYQRRVSGSVTNIGYSSGGHSQRIRSDTGKVWDRGLVKLLITVITRFYRDSVQIK